MAEKDKAVKCDIQQGIAYVVIDRPAALNALNNQVIRELGEIFSELEINPAVRAVILTGAGTRAFVAGADISEMKQFSVLEAREFALRVNHAQAKIESIAKPVIAAVNGFALGGGCELSLCCDIRIASSAAKFGQPEINLGIIPGGGGTQRFARLIGIGMAKELVFTGDLIDAQRAYELGLVSRVVPPETLMEEAQKIAAKIARKSLPVLRLAKEAFNYGYSMDLEKALKFEIECFANCFDVEDHNEGMSAFLEKRKPVFRDL
ncbi:MAG: enoyl-CoA hydratase-related protein [Syntrophales bacterium]